MFQEKIDILFTPRPSPLATSALGKLYLRKTRISRFVWAKRINGNLSCVPETFHARPPVFQIFIATRGLGPRAEGSRHPREKPLVPRVRGTSFIC